MVGDMFRSPFSSGNVRIGLLLVGGLIVKLPEVLCLGGKDTRSGYRRTRLMDGVWSMGDPLSQSEQHGSLWVRNATIVEVAIYPTPASDAMCTPSIPSSAPYDTSSGPARVKIPNPAEYACKSLNARRNQNTFCRKQCMRCKVDTVLDRRSIEAIRLSSPRICRASKLKVGMHTRLFRRDATSRIIDKCCFEKVQSILVQPRAQGA